MEILGSEVVGVGEAAVDKSGGKEGKVSELISSRLVSTAALPLPSSKLDKPSSRGQRAVLK